MEQLTLEDARQQADAGMRQALEHAEVVVPQWGELAYQRIVKYAREHERFCGWMVVKAAAMDPSFPAPPTEKAWGGPMKRAAHDGIIERVGTAKDPNRHGNPIPLWKSLVFQGAVP